MLRPLAPRERAPSTDRIGGWTSLNAGLGLLVKSMSLTRIKPRSSHFSDRAGYCCSCCYCRSFSDFFGRSHLLQGRLRPSVRLSTCFILETSERISIRFYILVCLRSVLSSIFVLISPTRSLLSRSNRVLSLIFSKLVCHRNVSAWHKI
jgi:hypothetical protein